MLKQTRLLQNSCKLTPPPLTGGGWGVGEAATCKFNGKLPPHPNPPPQGGRGLFRLLQEPQTILPILIVFICFSASASFAEEPLPPQNAFSVRDENSALGGHDENYTNGISIALTRKGKGPLGGVWDLVGKSDGERFATYELTQLMFSPDFRLSNPGPTDHPYAGLLYLGITTHLQSEKSLHSLKLIAGLAGPDAFAGEVQKFVHRIEGYDDPQGWAHQIKNEPVVNLFYEYRRKYALTTHDSEIDVDLIPMGGAFLGNYLIQAETDAQFRMGYLPNDFGTTVLRGSGYLPFPQAEKARHEWGIYAFAGGGASLVARNLVLDGNTFAHSRNVNKRPFLPAAEVGASLWTQRFQATFSYVFWGKEYYGQQIRENYLSGLLSCFF